METAKIAKGDVVVSIAGHDKGKFFFVTDVSGELLRLADGKLRKLGAPKRKNTKHVRYEARTDTSEALGRGDSVLDSQLRRALAEYRASASQNQRR